MPREFRERVVEVVRGLSPGDVVSYGDVAAEAGYPGAGRGVGAVLASFTGPLPWWRVVYADGRLAPGKEAEQARRLRAEGVAVSSRRVARAITAGSTETRSAEAQQTGARGSRAERIEDDGVQVSIIIPTRNEAPNIAHLIGRLATSMRRELGPGVAWEVIFVDDSDDATPSAIQAEADAGHPVALRHRRAGHRPGGLGGAVQDGFTVARGQTVAVMDGDLQHPPEILPRLLAPIMAGEADLVSGDRYGGAGDRGGLAGPWRRLVASSSRLLVHAVIPPSRALSDPMSGLFAFDRDGIEGLDLHANGFKILLEVVARGNWTRVGNVAYRFDRRHAGRSKASLREGWAFSRHLFGLARSTRCGG